MHHRWQTNRMHWKRWLTRSEGTLNSSRHLFLFIMSHTPASVSAKIGNSNEKECTASHIPAGYLSRAASLAQPNKMCGMKTLWSGAGIDKLRQSLPTFQAGLTCLPDVSFVGFWFQLLHGVHYDDGLTKTWQIVTDGGIDDRYPSMSKGNSTNKRWS